MIPNVCYLFLGLHGCIRKGKGFSVVRGEGKGTLLISPSHARTSAPEFLSPSFSKACYSDYLFFLIVDDVDFICATYTVLYLYIIEQ